MNMTSIMTHDVKSVQLTTGQHDDLTTLEIVISHDNRETETITCFSPYLPKGQKHEWFAAEKTENPSATLATYEYKTTPKNCDKCGQPVKGE